jgi:hypothetical protein
LHNNYENNIAKEARMNIKRFFMITLLLICTALIFANGQKEPNNGRRDELAQLIESKEKLTLTGTLTIKNRIMPELHAGTTTYLLAVPRFAAYRLGIEDGEEVTVEGVLLKAKAACPMKFLEEGDEVFFVTRAIVKGKEYDLKEEFGNCGFPGKGGRLNRSSQKHPGPGPHYGWDNFFE